MEKQFIKKRIEDKSEEIENYINELSSIVPETLEEYTSNYEKKAACERYAEKIPESAVDIAYLLIKYLELESPKNDKESFEILYQSNIISEKLSKKLQDAKGMRNIIAHEYGGISDEIVFEAVKEELPNDSKEFINIALKVIEK